MTTINSVTASPTSETQSGPSVSDLITRARQGLGRAAHEGSDYDSDITNLGATVQDMFISAEFLEAGKDSGRWFTMPRQIEKEILDAAESAGEDGRSIVAQLKALMNVLNGILARTDMSDEEKLAFLSAMLGERRADYDEEIETDPWKGLGTILAQVLAGDVEVLFEGKDLQAEELTTMVSSFHKAKGEYLKTQEIAVKSDTSWAELAAREERIYEREKKRAKMSDAEFLADVEREKLEKEAEATQEHRRAAASVKA